MQITDDEFDTFKTRQFFLEDVIISYSKIFTFYQRIAEIPRK